MTGPPSARSRGEAAVSLAEQLVVLHAEALRTASALVPRQDAEDVVQEATLRVLGAAARGATIDQPRAYLHAVVRTVASDLLRAPRLASPDLIAGAASTDADPQTVSELREVLDAIDGLPPGQRRALVGTVFTARDQRSLARALETTPAGLRQLVRRARRQLRDKVGAWAPWLTARPGELLAAISPGSGARSGAVALAVAAVVAPAAPAPPTPPEPPNPPELAVIAEPMPPPPPPAPVPPVAPTGPAR